MSPFERLVAWQHCHRLAILTYRVTAGFPQNELYGITSQMRRAASAAAATIAEGSAKRGRREFRRYLDMSVGSLAELEYFGILARDLGLLPKEDWDEFERLSSQAGKTTMGLYRAIARAEPSDGRSSRLTV